MCVNCVSSAEAAGAAAAFAVSGAAVAVRDLRVRMRHGRDGLAAWRALRRADAEAHTRAFLSALGHDPDEVMAMHEPARPARPRRPGGQDGLAVRAGSAAARVDRRMITSIST